MYRTARESDAHTRELLAQLAKRDETLGSLNSRLEEKQRENSALARQLESALTETRHQVGSYCWLRVCGMSVTGGAFHGD